MRQLYALLLCLCLSTSGWCQADLPSLIAAWNDTTRSAEDRLQTVKDLHIEFHQQYPDTVLFYLKEMCDLAESADAPLALYSAHNRMGSLLEKQGHLEEALISFDQAEQVAIALGDSARLGTVYGNRGNVHVQRNEYVEATRHFNRAMDLYEAVGDAERANKSRMALGNLFMIIGHHELAMAQFEMVRSGLRDAEDMGYFPGLLELNMGWCAYELEDYERASALYASALNTLEREEQGFYVAGCYENMSALSEELGALDEAMKYRVTAMEMYRDLGARGNELSCLLAIAELTLPSDPGKALRVVNDNERELLGQTGYEIKHQLYSVHVPGPQSAGSRRHGVANARVIRVV